MRSTDEQQNIDSGVKMKEGDGVPCMIAPATLNVVGSHPPTPLCLAPVIPRARRTIQCRVHSVSLLRPLECCWAWRLCSRWLFGAAACSEITERCELRRRAIHPSATGETASSLTRERRRLARLHDQRTLPAWNLIDRARFGHKPRTGRRSPQGLRASNGAQVHARRVGGPRSRLRI